MGQCSTLPEARNNSSAATRHDSSSQHHGGGGSSSRQRLKEDGRTESLDFNKLTTLSNENTTKALDQRKLHVTVPANGEHEFAKFNHQMDQQPQTRDPEQGHGDSGMADAMDIDQRDVSQPMYFPPPPECAVRTRCYKLNLDSEMIGLTGNKNPHISLGPFSEPPPPLTYSSSEDSALSGGDTNVAIQTAQIFRGITVAKDGTILSQNARATRSNRGKQSSKKGEKSRQAAKIDKAKDLVEESIATGKVRTYMRCLQSRLLGSHFIYHSHLNFLYLSTTTYFYQDPESKEPANMVSLVIVGAYDDMKHLVRDGSKKLREADGLSDDTLFSVNRPRTGAQGMMSPGSKNRVPPSSTGPRSTRGGPGIPQSAPPKLKSNPRDSRSKVRRADDKPRRGGFPESCNDMMDATPQGANGEGDWRDALGLSRGFHSIWNCGGAEEAGAVSPTQVCSPANVNKPHEVAPQHHHQPQQPPFEGRESTMGHIREGEMATRAN